ncbi:two-partner secretion domain-containing protein [Acinetobacter terrae]|uniref:two-partner secretion domain-containing protein n=1 Tax=Acinetobacter terrae TaxID=2731247 RepID=UPI0007D7BC67|nr:filamentous hemagglutinin N-terminal domain-containing protein [Acinetobacter terrae]OAL85465.1 hypothetical protein AY608_03320 [Acinetobacter terrae]
MNKIYKRIWNKQLSCWQAVSELAKSHQKSSQSSTSITDHQSHLGQKIGAALLFVSSALLPLSIQAAPAPNALPTGGNITSGNAQVARSGNTLNINQRSQNMSARWNTFDIGRNATVNFRQPNRSSVAVNQVRDRNASEIAGRLNSNGQVFLLNPNGVVFSRTAQVNVGGIVASTLNINDRNLQNSLRTGRYTLSGAANSRATVENQGSITTRSGGTVALIAPRVINSGTIRTPNGRTLLTSATQVTLALQNGSLTRYQIDRGALQSLVNNRGTIVANNGSVYLTGLEQNRLRRAVVNNSGVIRANRISLNNQGRITLVSTGPGNGNGYPGSGNGNGYPGSGNGNGYPGSGNGNGYPGSGNGNGYPGSGNGNGYPGSGNGNGYPGSGNGNGYPGSGNGNGNPGLVMEIQNQVTND